MRRVKLPTKDRHYRNFLALFAAATAALAAIMLATLLPHPASAQTADGTQQMAIPAYFYATSSYWTQLQSGSPTVGLAVMNPNSGPGSRQNADYVKTVNNTKAKKIKVYGYVYTSYVARRLSAVKSDIDKYYNWYNVDGIFLDEAEYRDCTDHSYYKNLYNHVKAKSAAVGKGGM